MNALVEMMGKKKKKKNPGASTQQRQILTATCIHLVRGMCGMKKAQHKRQARIHTYARLNNTFPSLSGVQSCASIQTCYVCQFKSVNFSVCAICTLGLNEKCLKLGVGRRIRATIRSFCRGISILTHLSISGYGSGRHKQPKNTHILCSSVCVGAPLRKTHWWRPIKKTSRVTPLFSRLLSYQSTSARATDSHPQL